MKPSYLIKQLSGTLLFFAIIFISAGRLNYWQGLAYVGIGLFMMGLNFTLLRIDASLQEERSKPGAGTRQWDKAILGLSFVVTIAMYVIAGLDSGRFHWSPEFPPALSVAGMALTAAGQLLFLIAQKQNRFFSSTVRIQADREHTVCETGLYRIVRHPAYMGSVIQATGFPLLFGSLRSILPVCMMIILLITRAALEDRTLINELNGYPEYALKTRYRLVPFIW